MAAHEAAHCPYMSWYEVCVAASGKEDAHARSSGLDFKTGLPVVSLDYEFLEGPVTVLIDRVKPLGAALAYACAAKGPTNQLIVKQLVCDLG